MKILVICSHPSGELTALPQTPSWRGGGLQASTIYPLHLAPTPLVHWHQFQCRLGSGHRPRPNPHSLYNLPRLRHDFAYVTLVSPRQTVITRVYIKNDDNDDEQSLVFFVSCNFMSCSLVCQFDVLQNHAM